MLPYCEKEKYAHIFSERICYIDVGEGDPLLFLHGLGGSMNNWAPNILHFREKYRVIALDLPGYGESQKCGADCSIEYFTGVVRGLLAQLGVNHAHVVGNSLGGALAINLALKSPEMVDSLVLVDTAGTHSFPFILRWAFRRWPRALLKRVVLFITSYLVRYRIFYRIAGVYNLNPYTRVVIDEAVDMGVRPDSDAFMDLYLDTGREALTARFDDRLPEISRPTLIIWGQKDLGIPLKVGQRINRLIQGSFLVAIPRAAHVPQLDQPEAFNSALERFLRGVR